MEQYSKEKKIGEGTYGIVWKARDTQSGQWVAVKELKKKFISLDECRNLVEVRSLMKLYNHPNIVRLLNLVKERDRVYMVFEYMESDLKEFMNQRARIFAEDEVRDLFFQVLRGLHYMHRSGYFHRDLKPSNLLVSEKGNGGVVKIADLGMATEIDCPLPRTQGVTTLWYRAPEVLLSAARYGPAIDMWAMGAILFEMLSSTVLFQGLTSLDQLYYICYVIGSPTEKSWPDGVRLLSRHIGQFPSTTGLNLSLLLPSASRDAIDLISRLCSWDPARRPTAEGALRHPFFRGCSGVPPPLSLLPHCSEATTGSLNNDTAVTYSTRKDPKNDDRQSACSCLKCEESQRRSAIHDPIIIKPANPTRRMCNPIGYKRPCQQQMITVRSRPPGF